MLVHHQNRLDFSACRIVVLLTGITVTDLSQLTKTAVTDLFRLVFPLSGPRLRQVTFCRSSVLSMGTILVPLHLEKLWRS